MAKNLEGLTLEEECTLLIALKTEMLKFKGLLEHSDFWLYKEKVNTIYSLFNKLGYDRQTADLYIDSKDHLWQLIKG